MSEHTDAVAKLSDIASIANLRAVHLLGWRDLDDPEAGGSEVHAHQIAKRWAEAGIDVTMRTSFAANRPSLGLRDGYRVIRKAGRYLVFPRAIASEISGRMGPRDAIVEIWNGVPFLTPLWWRGPRMVWLHHVHGEMWHQIFSPQIAALGERMESKWAPVWYRRTPIVTLSPSSRDQICEKLAFHRESVHVVEPGIDGRFTPGGTKSARPLVTFVGRIVPVKRLDAMVAAMVDLRTRIPDLEVMLVGEGYARPEIERLVREVGAERWITLSGRLPDAQLLRLYRRSWAITSFSGHEGWGMTITEAAACGTPAVVSDIPGHRDAVIAGSSGLLGATDRDVVDALERVLTDPDLRARLGEGARQRAAQLTWDRTAVRTLEILADDVRNRR